MHGITKPPQEQKRIDSTNFINLLPVPLVKKEYLRPTLAGVDSWGRKIESSEDVRCSKARYGMECAGYVSLTTVCRKARSLRRAQNILMRRKIITNKDELLRSVFQHWRDWVRGMTGSCFILSCWCNHLHI